MISVVETTTEEREQEIADMFNEIKPLLEEGHTYHRACLVVFGSTFVRSAKYKHVVEYGEKQGYSKKLASLRRRYWKGSPSKPSKKSKYGIVHLGLTKRRFYLTGYSWTYSFVDSDGKQRVIYRGDLLELRKAVESKGLSWVVDDVNKAKESYELNKRMHKNARKGLNKNKTGVLYVSKSKCIRCRQKYTWQYYVHNSEKCAHISSTNPQGLKQKVLDKGLEWIVVDEEKARSNGLL